MRHRRRRPLLVSSWQPARTSSPRSRSYVFARGLLRHQLTRIYFPDSRRTRPTVLRARRSASDAGRAARGAGLRSTSACRATRQTVFFALTTFDALFVPDDAARGGRRRRVARARCSTPSARSRSVGESGSIRATQRRDRRAVRPALYDVERLVDEGRAAGNPGEPLVRALRERSEATRHATSTTARRARTCSTRAAMLVARTRTAI